ncbi:MAG: hypothetical protein KAI88_02670 [Nitrosomonadaceae bacterium]|nr:hypothetical protein [Alphaproteobacteria bacterium]MCK5435509.1 hypothetical protein [Nitrosomonadaceae bacterium]
MTFSQDIQEKFEELEVSSVSDSFGGNKLDGRAPDFKFTPIIHWMCDEKARFDGSVCENIQTLKMQLGEQAFKYTMEALGRFSFCIELTNLKITSTKMKTRWYPGKIIKTRLSSFENYEGEFSPGHDKRSSKFDICLEIFKKSLSLIASSPDHINVMKWFSSSSSRGTPYEAVWTYVNPALTLVHVENNIRLVNLDDAKWLVKSRPIIRSVLTQKNKEKIATKCYKTDRAQTGDVQTNRAKRWECLTEDYQHSTQEQCWSVERKLLSGLLHFEGFPEKQKKNLVDAGLFGDQGATICPVTFQPMKFEEFQGKVNHGESKFQVGHMNPLKTGGVHNGDNIAWISNDGNRIQGSLGLQETREMLVSIFEKMQSNGLIT